MRVRDILKGKWIRCEKVALEPGGAKAWDGAATITPFVFKPPASKGYGMFYTGQSYVSDSWAIGYAESEDIINWRKYHQNPILLYDGENQLCQLDGPCLVKQKDTSYLFCEVKEVKVDLTVKVKSVIPPRLKSVLRKFRRTQRRFPQAVEHARDRYFVRFSSSDILNWNLDTKRVILEKYNYEGGFDSRGVFSPQVYLVDGTYYMFYGGSDGYKASTGIAVSDDLIKWHRTDFSPVLTPGKKGDWDEHNALIVSILKTEDGYCGFYEGEDAEGKYRIGLVYSFDLKHWEKFESNPIIDITSSESMVCSPHILATENRLLLFHSSHDVNMRGCCVVAEFNG